MSVNWEHTHLDDAKTHELSPEAAKKLIGNGIGEITRPSDRHTDAKSATEFANAIQKCLVEKTRLGIPALLHEEALHGFVGAVGDQLPAGDRARRPPAIPELVEQVFTVAARQARARGVQHVLAPVIDVARDPRWGRIEETYGEDPYLVSRMGVAAVRGFQGRRGPDAPIDAAHVAATAKHFTGHGTPEGGTQHRARQLLDARAARGLPAAVRGGRPRGARSPASCRATTRSTASRRTPTAGC